MTICKILYLRYYLGNVFYYLTFSMFHPKKLLSWALIFLQFLSFFYIFVPQTVHATATSTVYVGTATDAANGANVWTTPTNAQGDTTGTSTVSTVNGNAKSSNQLRLTNFNLSGAWLPGWATINGITVEIEYNSTTNFTNSLVQLTKDGWTTLIGTNKATNVAQTTKALTTFWWSADLWGTTWTATELQSANFWVVVAFVSTSWSNGHTANVYRARVTVDYTGDVIPPVITINDWVAVWLVTSDTINVTVTEANPDTATYKYAYSTDAICNSSDFVGWEPSYTSWTNFTINTETNNGKYLCFKAADLSANTTYQISSNVLNIDVTNPSITITDNVVAWPVASDTVAATISDTNISLREYSLSADATCNATDFPGTTYTNGSTLTFNTETNNGKWVCFKWADSVWNISYVTGANSLNIDVTNPSISITNDVAAWPVTSDDVVATISDTNISLREYSLSIDSTCNALDFPGTTYTNGSTLTFNTETNNGKYVCFKWADSLWNITYAASANALNIDITNPSISITDNVAAWPVIIEAVIANITDTNISLREYSLSVDAVCDASDFPGTTYTNGSTLTFNTETNNGKYVCFKWQDSAGNITYLVSANDINVDATVPVISEVTPVSTPTSDTTPDYIFNSSEIGTIMYWWDCSSTQTWAILWNNTITFNSLSEWTHSNCTIYVVDGVGQTSSILSVSAFVIDTTPPTITINDNVAVWPVQSDTLNVNPSDSSGIGSTHYWFSADAVCDVTDTYPNVYTGSVDFTISTEANNGNYVCFRAIDTLGNTGYQVSSTILNIDVTSPSVLLIMWQHDQFYKMM